MKKIITVIFDYGEENKFHVLHEVFKKSANKNTKAEIISYHLSEPPIRHHRSRKFISNSVKLEKWVDELQLCNNGDHVVLMDCDMLILNDFFDIFNEKFDIGYTTRTNSKWPLNGGVIFVNVNDKSRRFMKDLLAVNSLMLKDVSFHKKWQSRYAGINQSAFGYMLENEYCKSRVVKPFPCSIYNACGEDLPDFNRNKTKILHIKGKLRQAIFKEIKIEPELADPISVWNEYAEMR